jgi:glycosyltransferase involved in cell wall biosynthesis
VVAADADLAHNGADAVDSGDYRGMDARRINIVVPVYNEADTPDPLVAEIREMAEASNLAPRVVFVDDGSTDGSWVKIVELAESDAAIGAIRFRRNAGKTAALMAGFGAVREDVVVMMDADLQDPPAEVPTLIARLDEGFDLVSGWKRNRHDPWHKVYPSRVFNRLVGWLTGVKLHDHVCGLKCFRREVAKDFELHGDFHRFLGVLAAANGYRVTEVETLHRPRTHGHSKYGFARFFRGLADLLTVWLLTRKGGCRRIGLKLAGPPSAELYDVAERIGWCGDSSNESPEQVNP